jgi:hypothetical protein
LINRNDASIINGYAEPAIALSAVAVWRSTSSCCVSSWTNPNLSQGDREQLVVGLIQSDWRLLSDFEIRLICLL